jgi:Uma2 family endonuclease
MLDRMPTVVLDPPPVELQALLEQRKRLDQDRHDEIWKGVLHMAPAPHDAHADIQQQLAELMGPLARQAGLRPLISGEFNIGEPEDFRVPDGGLLRGREPATWHPTAALAVEIVSPGDESWDKLPFYAAHEIDELLIVDPATRKVDWLALTDGEYRPVDRSGLIDLGPKALGEHLDWPPGE